MTPERVAETSALEVTSPRPEDEDKALTLAFKAGDGRAYDQIYARYSGRVNGVCRRMLTQPDDAQEAAQEAFLRVYQALPRFNGRYQLGAWITRIATNVCLDQLRSRTRKPSDCLPSEILELEAGPDEVSDPESICIRRAEGRRVKKLLAQLPPTHRAAIVLRDFEGLSYEEIAIALDMSDTQVKALIHRARKGFKRSWAELASMFLPARLVHRLHLDGAKDRAGQALTPATPLASQCSSMLQSCAQVMTEHVATVVTATVVVGAAAMPMTVGRLTPTAPVTPSAQAQSEISLGESDPALAMRMPTRKPARQKVTSEPAVTEPEEPTAPAVVPEPTPEPEAPPTEPAPEPEPEETAPPADNGGGTKPQPDPSQTPQELVIPPTDPSFAFERGGTNPQAAPVSSAVDVRCSMGAFTQAISTTIADGATNLPMRADLRGESSLGIQMTVQAARHTVTYSGGATLLSRTESGRYLSLSYRGSYGTDTNQANKAGLPENGIFRADVTLDCANLSVVTESLTFAS
jgi:RNA polymerase sigma-70 factor (ECF subfamily)